MSALASGLEVMPLYKVIVDQRAAAAMSFAVEARRREIAAVLLDSSAQTIPAIEWKNVALRKKINRIVASAIALMNGGYLTLLRGDPARAKRFRRR